MVEYDKGGGRRLLVGYTDDRAKKDAYNREKGIRRLEKAYKHGALTKGNINKRGYNKFLSMDGEVKVAINYDRVADDSKWDGLKGYLTNMDIPIQDVYTAYHNLWHVERAFRIAKSKIEIQAHPINLGEEALCFETNIVSLPYGQSRTISVGAIDIAIRDTF